MAYTEQKFSIPELEGISKASIDQHIGLYQGYVKNFNAISAALPEYAADPEKNALAIAELVRRKSFEFGGMRLHELYFPQFEGGASALGASGSFAKQIEQEYHKTDYFIEYFKTVASLRGPGWALLYWDAKGKQLQTGFTGEQHMGSFATLPVLLALDVWEHAYVLDYGASGRGKYIDAFFKNLNWGVVAKRFEEAST